MHSMERGLIVRQPFADGPVKRKIRALNYIKQSTRSLTNFEARTTREEKISVVVPHCRKLNPRPRGTALAQKPLRPAPRYLIEQVAISVRRVAFNHPILSHSPDRKQILRGGLQFGVRTSVQALPNPNFSIVPNYG